MKKNQTNKLEQKELTFIQVSNRACSSHVWQRAPGSFLICLEQ